jgi:lysophospholipase L1-like esterase
MQAIHAFRIKAIAALSVLLLATHPVAAQNVSHPTRWVGSWASSQQALDAEGAFSAAELRGATLRQIVHLSIGGSEFRVRFSNAFGRMPLRLTSAHIARAKSSANPEIDTATDKALSFSGEASVTIPADSDYLSDTIAFATPALSDVAVTIQIGEAAEPVTGHSDSRASSYLITGDSVAGSILLHARTATHWYFLAGVDVAASADASSIVILGDSITDGHTASVNANDRWTDQLARRLHNLEATQDRGVLNEGIGGNRLLLDGLGPNAMARFDRDVLSESGVGYLILLEGINDLGTLTIDGEVSHAAHEALVLHILSAYSQMIMRAHDHGIKVIGATLMPYAGTPYYASSPVTEADRQAINQWIRAPGHFDAVIDFDEVLRDPLRPDHILGAYDSGDHIHPSPKGYIEMGNAVSLQIFSR